MATSEPDIKTKIAEIRHEILSYKPGKAVPCADELIVFPDRLVIGLIDAHRIYSYNIVHALRSALHGDVEADRRETSTEGQEKYLTDSISVTERIHDYWSLDIIRDPEEEVKDLAAKVACFVVFHTNSRYLDFSRKAVRKIKDITGCYPIVGLWNFSKDDVKRERERMRKEGIVEVYEIPKSYESLADTEQLELLSLLRECLRKGDVALANYSKQLRPTTNPVHRFLYEKAKKEITEKQKMTEEIRQHKRVEESLQQEMKTLQMKLEESSASRESLDSDNARLKKEIVCEKEKREQAELAMAENDKMAKNSQEMYKKREAKLEKELKTKEEHIKEQKDKVKEREETARRKVEQIKKEKEEERGRAAQLKEEVESNQRRVNSLAKLVEEKKHDKATLKQQVNRLETEIEERTRREKENLSALKNELKSEKERVEQLERETWKLRTKIQLESEIRSAEQKKKVETPRWSFIPWIVSGKQTRTVQSPSEDPSRERLEESDAMQTGEEPPNDDFEDILKQIADDLSDDAKIDSLGGQLGILQGDIDRALKTNMRYEQITSRGTYLMLKQWRRGVSREDERIALRRALEAAKLLNIADRYLPQEGSTASDHSKKVEDPHRLSREYGTASKQGSSKESPKHNIDDKQYAPEDIMTSGCESEEAAEVTGTDQPKLEDPHGQSGKDGPPLGQGSPRGQTEVEETRATIERSSPGDTSYMNEEENEGANQQSEESSNHSTTNVQDISEDMPSSEMFNEETSTSNENQIEYITTMFDDVVSSLVFSDAYQEKLYVLLFAKVIIDSKLRRPIHHTQDEQATPPEALDEHPKAGQHHSEGIFDQRGGELTIPSHGLTLTIPPGALGEGVSEKIGVDILQDKLADITVRDDEMAVTSTFQCLPSGLHFAPDKPVALKMPHCANLTDPKKVQAVLYYWNHEEEGKPERILLTSRTCQVTPNRVEIFLQHFSRGFLAFIIDWWYMSGKRMSFMPFLPRTMPLSRNAVLEFRMVNKPHGKSWRDIHDIRKDATYQPAKDHDDEMNVKDEDLTVTCQLNNNGIREKNVKRDFVRKTEHTVYFNLDFTGKADDLLVELKLIQSELMEIEFRTQFLPCLAVVSSSAAALLSSSVASSLSSMATASSSASATASSSEEALPPSAASPSSVATSPSPSPPAASQKRVDDQKLNKLSEQIPTDKYIVFSDLIGFEYNKANGILASNNNNHCKAVRHCLGGWKDRTGGSLQELKEILEAAELKALTKYIEPEDFK